MDPHTELNFFYHILIIFSFSVIVISCCYRLKIPESLAYLFVGFVLGPSVLNIIDHSKKIDLLAEIGVVFLLFSLGLEFSLSKMMNMRQLVFGLGGLQVLISTIIIGFVGLFCGMDLITSIIMAAGLSLSSTAIVSKELSRRNEIRTTHGKASISILIFQDIAAVLFLIIVTSLSASPSLHLGTSLLLSFLKGIIFVLIMLIIGKKVLPYIFHTVASTRSEELFVLTAIVVALLAAMFSHILGLSMALGGFVAGVMLGESHYKHQVEIDIRPFRDILLGLFFVSIGLIININDLISQLSIIIIGTTLLILFKIILITFLAQMLGVDKKNAIKAGLSLAQGGEFCFALIALANQLSLLNESISSMILSITIISMIISPFLIHYSDNIANIFNGKKISRTQYKTDIRPVKQATREVVSHILVCGYGRVGQIIGRFIIDEKIPFIALDDDPLHVKEANQAGEPVFYGDCRRQEILKAAGISKAKMAIICLDNSRTANKVLLLIRQLNPKLPVLIRTRDDNMMETLYKNGATRLIPETLESSLLIVGHFLSMIGKKEHEIRQKIQSVRQKKYRRLHGLFFGEAESLYTIEGEPISVRHAFSLEEDHFAVNKTLSSLNLEKLGIEIDKIIRNQQQLDPEEAQKLQPNDLIILSGQAQYISKAEEILSKGLKG